MEDEKRSRQVAEQTVQEMESLKEVCEGCFGEEYCRSRWPMLYKLYENTKLVKSSYMKATMEISKNMEYTILKKNTYAERGLRVSVKKNYINLSWEFRKELDGMDAVQFASNSDGCLCFRFARKEDMNSYSITRGGKYKAITLRIPTAVMKLGIECGYYSVIKDGEWYVTSCKFVKEVNDA